MSSIDYNDERFAQVEAQKQATMNKVSDTYNGMIGNTDSYYNDLKQATQDYETKQTELQQARTDQTIKEINQNKEQAEKDYLKEQKASYADYAKQTNAYGANAEQMASAGLAGSGYSESSKVSMYNTYQNRYAVARESYNQAILNYNNQIAQAELANSSVLAEIAFNSLQKQLELALEGFQYKNTLLTNKLNTELDVDNSYYTRYQDVVNQLNTERAFDEQVRQFNEQMAYQRQRDAVADSQWQQQYALSVKKANASSSKVKTNFSDNNLGTGGDFSSNTNSSRISALSNDTIGLNDNGKRYSFSLTEDTKFKDIVDWAKRNGVTLTEEELYELGGVFSQGGK